ncbi:MULTISPECIES: hypothetical protein [unclassified Chitinophaga]|uniref:hypothetical protein n=1 Tax=unclassified Chitinophaga TaxID=2619133 RepID=UPI0009D59825|nr:MULTISPECIES: hypothetical protein [unclassified Chitinophaga]OMP77863.1 hypothetical protein BW716_17450 [[Flexibacter] sp. ATCC 35208]WPV65874.1 hypothetical protein QQL36_29155 [Chitinophaga sp. LS1]
MDFSKIWEFFIPEKKTTSNKLFVLFIFIAGIIFVNDIFSFTFFYRIDKKIAIIREMNAIINDTQGDSSTHKSLLEMRNDVITQSPAIIGFPESVFKNNQGLIPWLFYLTAILLNAFIIIFGFALVFMKQDKNERMSLKDYFSVFPYYIGTTLITLFICLIIPKFPLWGYLFTYILNFIIHVLLLLVMLAYTTGSNTSQKETES